MKGTRAFFAAVAAIYLASCTTEATVEGTQGLDNVFAEAADTYDVPVDLLKAVSYVETRWNAVVGEDEMGRPAGFGVFGLWGDNLALGAAAAGFDVDTVRADTRANIQAGAARLAELASQQGVSGSDLMAWRPVLATYAQSDDLEARDAYVDDVVRALAGGAQSIAEDGTVIASIQAHGDITMPEPTTLAAGSTDFAGAIWRNSPNFNSRNGSAVSLVVIHSCEGAYSGCWGWLRNTQAQASAHYVVNESGSEVTQLVREANRAWHVAAAYQCANAGNSQCNKNGVSTNNFSVGIEHAGFASQTSWSNGIIEKSAALTCDITKRHSVPRDRNHIVSHGQLQPYNRVDPGPNWPWSHYIDRVREICGDGGGGGGGGGSIIVDSNNANNDQNVAKLELSGTWTASTNVAGYYGTGYYYANTAQSSAPATFKFHLASAGARTVEVWYTAASDRATAAPFIAFNASGTEVGRKLVNQTTSGGQWVTIGTFNFTAGWNSVVLSRWTSSGSVVVADAVRVK